MVTHHYDWRKLSQGIESVRTIRQWTQEELCVLILANMDPRNDRRHRFICSCPKIGRKWCKECKGEGHYWYGKDEEDYERERGITR